MGHTPGPWKEFASDLNRWIANAETGEIVCDQPHINYRDDRLEVRWKRNVPLLEAAPDLLAALEHLMKAEPMQQGERNGYVMGTISQAIDMARAAIAKAKGQA